MAFAIHQCELAIGINMPLHPEPSPTSLPTVPPGSEVNRRKTNAVH